MKARQKVLVIGFVWPEPKSTAAGKRLLQIISILQENQYDIVFATAAQESEHSDDLKLSGITCEKIELNSATFDQFLSALNPEMVLFDRFMTEEQFGWRVAKVCPNAVRVLDCEDLHCLRSAREKAVMENRPFKITDLFDEPVALREIASIQRCDLSVLISEFEMELLQEVFGLRSHSLFYLPLFARLPEKVENLPSFRDREGFIFIGNFLHNPNADAVSYLKKDIWPRIRKQLPDAALTIYGAYAPQKYLQMHNTYDGFLVHGRIDDPLPAVANAKAVLAPLRFGAGVKGKLIEAMQCGTPSVTTTIGAEGMTGDLPWSGSIADEADAFAAAAVALYNNESLWVDCQQNGFQIIRRRHQLQDFREALIMRLDVLQLNLHIHRKKDFNGLMLQYHSMRNSEYFSRWIQEKNRLL